VTQDARDRVAAALADLRGGAPPFTGPIVDRNGTIRVRTGVALTDRQVDHMDWWVDGVIGDAP
jgi:hypothetical protein